MTRRARRVLHSGSLAAMISTLGGAIIGMMMDFPMWFFCVDGLILAIGLLVYPSKSRYHRYHSSRLAKVKMKEE